MLAQNHLTLRLVRLKPGEEWLNRGPGTSFVFPQGGEGQYLSGPAAQRLVPGDVLLLHVAAAGRLCSANGGETVFRIFSLSFEHLFPLFASNEIRLLQTAAEAFNGVKLYPAAGGLARECHRLVGAVPPQFNLDHRCQLLRVVAAILSVEFKHAPGRRAGFVRVEEHLMQVFEKLSVVELLTLSVGELADKFSCRRRHLNRLFHQHFGFSVAGLRMEMRLLKAVSLLRDPDAKIINVAEQCGFNHLGLFNTCFKRRFGATPGQWRKAAVGTEGLPRTLGDGSRPCPLQANGLCPGPHHPAGDPRPAVRVAAQMATADAGHPLIKIQVLNPPAAPAPGPPPREVLGDPGRPAKSLKSGLKI